MSFSYNEFSYMGNAAQGTLVGFARNLLADFPPYHPKAL